MGHSRADASYEIRKPTIYVHQQSPADFQLGKTCIAERCTAEEFRHDHPDVTKPTP